MKRYFYGIDKDNKIHRFSVKAMRDKDITILPLSATDSLVRSAKHIAKKDNQWPIKLS
jgi:hypothetical protein